MDAAQVMDFLLAMAAILVPLWLASLLVARLDRSGERRDESEIS